MMVKPLTFTFALLLFAVISISAQEAAPPEDKLHHAFPPVKKFSPYAGRNYPTRVFWGDTHVHTANSMDAGAFGARLLPVDAFRFARGEEVTASGGFQVKLSRPLDFLVVADLSDNMGFFTKLFKGDPQYLSDETGRRWYDMIQAGGAESVKAATEVIDRFSKGTFPAALACLPGSEAYRSTWEETIKAAEDYNAPGRFTASLDMNGHPIQVATICTGSSSTEITRIKQF